MDTSTKRRLHLKLILAFVIGAYLIRPVSAAPVRQAGIIEPLETPIPPSDPLAISAQPTLRPVAFLPLVFGDSNSCPTTSSASYGVIGINGGYFKNNALTDANADFRLSILGYAPSAGTLTYQYYGGTPDVDGPRLGDVFTPHRSPTFLRAFQVYTWDWNNPAPYGSRGPVNTGLQWDTTVVDVATTRGEKIAIPARNAQIATNYRAMVLYAGANEITVVYMNQDQVQVGGTGYVVHLMNFCVDPNLVSLYRAQLNSQGYRSTHNLPALNNDQSIGTAKGSYITMAVRDGGAYMDPRSKNDWWVGVP